MTPILEVKSLSVTFTQYVGRGTARRVLPCVSGLNLAVSAGEISAVVGPSGSGKSLLAHAVLGILPYNAAMEGALYYRGEALTPRRAQALRGREIALVPQGVSHLDPLMTVGAQLRRGRRDGETRRAVDAVLARYGLPDVADKYPFELSGGMARRVLIASAVLEGPSLVIANEPTPGLDEATARRVMSHFRELAEGGAAVLLITHDLALAAATADRVTVLREGTAVASFPAGDFGAPATLENPYVAALWRAMPEHEFQGVTL